MPVRDIGAQRAHISDVKLLVQPDSGVKPLVKGIDGAKTSVDILIFRFDRPEIEKALISAVQRGVAVRALIAHTNRGGESRLRALEMRLLAAGVTVARTADDLIRYHAKIMIIDNRLLYLLAFNFTRLDIDASRSFGIVTDNEKTVREAVSLFDADSKRQPYSPGLNNFIVSPVNARQQLTEFLQGAKRKLQIYDPQVGDAAMVRVLQDRVAAGVEIRLLGRLSCKAEGIEVHKLCMRLHARMIIRDESLVFLGSQSLRTAELDSRREVGLIFRQPRITSRLLKIFESDWLESEKPRAAKLASDVPISPADTTPLAKVAKKVAKVVAKEIVPVGPVLDEVVREVSGNNHAMDLNPGLLDDAVRDAVKSAVKEVVADAVLQATNGHPPDEPPASEAASEAK